MEYIKLGEICNVKTGKLDANASTENGSYPFFTCSKEPLKIDSYSYDCECVLVAGNGDLNVKYYNGKFDAYQRTYIIEVLDKSRFDTKFIYLLIDSKIEELRDASIGGVIKYIKLGNLTDIKVPILSLENQKNIVKKLDLVQKLIHYKSNQIKKLNELIKSQFAEMFGELNINDKKWKTSRLDQICYSIGDGLHGTPQYDNDNEYFFINGNNLIDGKIVINSSTKSVSKEIYEKLYIKMDDNTILLSINGTLGKLAFYNNEKICLGKSACYINLREDVNKYFVYNLMKTDSFKKYLSCSSTGTTIVNVGLKAIREYRIILPPIELQNQFAEFAKQIEKQKFELEKQLEKLEELQDSLMQEYFG